MLSILPCSYHANLIGPLCHIKSNENFIILYTFFSMTGVFFTSRVEHVKFVDFCGKYRLPLLEYLCSSRCKTSPLIYGSSESESEEELPVVSKMRKVLLG